MNQWETFGLSAVAGYILTSVVAREIVSHHAGGGGTINGWFVDTGGTQAGQHGAGNYTPNSPKCVCTDVHKCTPDAKIAGVNLFKNQSWLPSKPGSCRPDLTIYGFNYFDTNCCPAGTYGGPPRPGPFNVSCHGVQGTGGGYAGG